MQPSYFRVITGFLQIFLIFTGFSSSALAQGIAAPDPEISTGYEEKSAARGDDFMIVTAHPLATQAGYRILEKGGSAVDAAIAAQLVLGLVEPQSSGLGGGGFLLHYDADSKRLTTLDGRETAPNLSGPFHFYKDGKPMDFQDALLGGRAVGVPGLPMMLEQAHQLYGKVTWMELFDDAIALAKDGFQVTPRLEAMIKEHEARLKIFPETADYFFDANGEALSAGWTLTNPAYEETLREYQFYGASRFYRGAIANEIVQSVQNIESNPGLLTLNDFYGYEAKLRKPVCGPYRSYIVCSVGEPSSGGLTMLEILGMVERFDLPGWGAEDARSWHVLAQASRLAFADRNLYMADPDFVNTPGVALLDPNYIAARSALIDPAAPLESVEAGSPPLWEGPLYEKGLDPDLPGTTHISVIDKDGNIASLTSSIESAFGAHVMVSGYLLNNQLTDFSFTPFGADGALVANMVEAGKRPRSSMAPTIVFDAGGKPVLVIGSAGGSNIIGYVVQRIISVLDWGMDVQSALEQGNFVARGDVIEVEESMSARDKLISIGDKVEIKDKNSGLAAIYIEDGAYLGAADPRREGTAAGQ